MESQRTGKSHVTPWVLAVVAVPVLYVLTAPVVYWAYAQTAPGPHAPGWLIAYTVPLEWLMTTPLRDPLELYFDWMMELLSGV